MLNYQNNVGDTALHLACMNDNAPAINFLIKNGVNIDIQNNVGDTALHLACIDGNESAINSLLFNGAKVDIQNSAGRYPLDMLYKKCGSLLNIIGKIRKINDSSTYYIEESFEKKIQKVVKNPKTI
jgi:ankyrin repeat protein